MNTSKVVLIIIYNHKYDKNIDLLEKIYENRFSSIYHLVPFYTGDKPNVIPVYENSFYFQGYIAQGVKSFFNEKAEHYFFVADDMIINPAINENNYSDYFNVDDNTSFLPDFFNVHREEYWPHRLKGFLFQLDKEGIEVKGELPSYQEAESRLLKVGAIKRPLEQERPLKWIDLYEKPGRNLLVKENRTRSAHQFSDFVYKKEYRLNYPLAASYSDILVVSAQSIKQFCHYCGVFAALDLFVEMALPTALALSADKIVTEKDLAYEGKPLWLEAVSEFLSPYKNNLELLITNYPENVLYIHPIKLSQWDCSCLKK